MTTSYNVALLRSMRAPLLDSLAAVGNAVQIALDEHAEVSSDVVKQAHLVVGSLTMIKAKSVTRIALTLEALLQSLTSHDKPSGSDHRRSMQIALDGAQSLHSYLRHLLNGRIDQPVRLWGVWANMCAALNQAAPKVEDLFDGTASLDDLPFEALSRDALQERMAEIRPSWDENVRNWEAASNGLAADPALVNLMHVADTLLAWRHGRLYHAYWLALAARLELARFRIADEMVDRQPLQESLTRAGQELWKFAENHRHPNDEAMHELLIPMIQARAVGVGPRYDEMVRRFGLQDFWQAVDQVEKSEKSMTNASGQRWSEWKNHWRQLKMEWEKALESGNHRGMIKAAAQWPSKIAALSSPSMEALGQGLGAWAKAASEEKPLSSLAVQEMATLLVLGDAWIEQEGQESDETVAQCKLQCQRLVLALSGRDDDVRKMPLARLDRETQAIKSNDAMRQVLREVAKNLTRMERLLNAWMRTPKPEGDEDDAEDIEGESAAWEEFDARMEEWTRVSRLGVGALTLMRAEAASTVWGAVDDVVQEWSKERREFNDAERVCLTQGISGLSVFVQAVAQGDRQAVQTLEGAVQALRAFRETDALVELSHRFQADVDGGSGAPARVEPWLVHEPSSDESSFASKEGEEEEANEVVVESETFVEPALVRPLEDAPVEGVDVAHDRELADLFVEEMAEQLQTLDEALNALQTRPENDAESWAAMRRVFHSLKGSGRTAGFKALGEVAWRLEQRLDEHLEGAGEVTPALVEALLIAQRRWQGWYQILRDSVASVAENEPLRLVVDDEDVRAALAAAVAMGQDDDVDEDHDDNALPEFPEAVSLIELPAPSVEPSVDEGLAERAVGLMGRSLPPSSEALESGAAASDEADPMRANRLDESAPKADEESSADEFAHRLNLARVHDAIVNLEALTSDSVVPAFCRWEMSVVVQHAEASPWWPTSYLELAKAVQEALNRLENKPVSPEAWDVLTWALSVLKEGLDGRFQERLDQDPEWGDLVEGVRQVAVEHPLEDAVDHPHQDPAETSGMEEHSRPSLPIDPLATGISTSLDVLNQAFDDPVQPDEASDPSPSSSSIEDETSLDVAMVDGIHQAYQVLEDLDQTVHDEAREADDALTMTSAEAALFEMPALPAQTAVLAQAVSLLDRKELALEALDALSTMAVQIQRLHKVFSTLIDDEMDLDDEANQESSA